jgi:Uma2 family endonuclease
MTLAIDVAFLPATLSSHPMTDEEFVSFCAEHPDLNFEMTADGQLLVKPQTFTLTGFRNQEISLQLGSWAKRDRRGYAGESSTGFVLPNGARRSPDAAWIRKDRMKALSAESLNSFWRLCPDFVIELRSQSDRLPALRDKMNEYLANGAELGWLIDPDARTVEVYRSGQAPEILTNPVALVGEGPVQGLVLDLLPVWDPLQS